MAIRRWWNMQTGQAVEKCVLTGTIRTDQGNNFALIDVHVDIDDGSYPTEIKVQVVNGQEWKRGVCQKCHGMVVVCRFGALK